jgi:hypothetical protein
VAKELGKDVLNRLARLGAQARLDELEAERRAILRAFPDLSSSGAKAAKPAAETAGRTAKPAQRRKKRQVSPAARKAASERMKQYWAAKKQAAS